MRENRFALIWSTRVVDENITLQKTLALVETFYDKTTLEIEEWQAGEWTVIWRGKDEFTGVKPD